LYALNLRIGASRYIEPNNVGASPRGAHRELRTELFTRYMLATKMPFNQYRNLNNLNTS